jgi:DNA-binding CsgD family transcriptional regulator
VAQGCSTAKIANALFISELTVSTHRKNILRKLNLENSVQLGNYLHLFN